jgi:uncharacterized protein (TIGR02118 family)
MTTSSPPRLKFVVVCHRRPGLSRAEFRRYFDEVHGPLAMAIPDVRRYVQNFVEGDPATGDPPWDAVIEFWFDDRAAYAAAWASGEGRRAAADNANFLDMERTSWAIVEEREPRG